MATSIKEISEEHLEEFVRRVFPQFIDEDRNILSEEAMMEVLTDPMFDDDLHVGNDDDKLKIDEEFVGPVFPQFTNEDKNILSEEAMTEVSTDPKLMFVDDFHVGDDDNNNKLIIDEEYHSSEKGRTRLEGGEEEMIHELEDLEGVEQEIIREFVDDVSSEDLSLTKEIVKMFKEQEIQSLNLADCVITEDDDKRSSPSSQYRCLAFEASIRRSNLVHIDLSNSYFVDDEEEILSLLKTTMAKMEHLDISYIRFRNSKYPSKQVFANVFWQHVADHAVYCWPNLQTITAYGYPLKSMANALKIAQKVRSINATVPSARTARNMLKRMPKQTAKNSNLCDKWSGLISAGKTQYTNTGGGAVDNEFVSVLVPSYLDIDVDRIEGEVAESIKTILTKTPLDVSIAIAFPFFAAKSSQQKASQRYSPEEVELLVVLCQEAFKLGLDEKYAMQLELFLTELTKGDYYSRLATLYFEMDEGGYNIFTRHICCGSGRRLLASVENCIKRGMIGT